MPVCVDLLWEAFVPVAATLEDLLDHPHNLQVGVLSTRHIEDDRKLSA